MSKNPSEDSLNSEERVFFKNSIINDTLRFIVHLIQIRRMKGLDYGYSLKCIIFANTRMGWAHSLKST